MADLQPDATMLAPIERIAQFIATGDFAALSGFADNNVAIIENFAPYFFAGPNAVTLWAEGMRSHMQAVTGAKHRFGPAQNVSVDDGIAFMSLPTKWTGVVGGRRFDEDGGWAFVIVKQRGEWRVRNYGWAVTRLSLE